MTGFWNDICLNDIEIALMNRKWESPMFGPWAYDVAHFYVYCFYQKCLFRSKCQKLLLQDS